MYVQVQREGTPPWLIIRWKEDSVLQHWPAWISFDQHWPRSRRRGVEMALEEGEDVGRDLVQI
jgi:hypothetical protein